MLFIVTLSMTMMIDDSYIFAEQSNSSDMLDFSEELQSREFYIDLDGEWFFFEEELLTPNQVNEQLKNGNGRTVTLPSSFEAQTGEVNSFGTYSTIVKIPEQYIGETLAIYIPFQYSAYTLYVDQTEVSKNGTVGVDPTSHNAEMAPKTSYFIAQSEEVLLTMQVSSFDHLRGGFENSIYLEKPQ